MIILMVVVWWTKPLGSDHYVDLRNLCHHTLLLGRPGQIANSATLAECPSDGLQRLSRVSGHLVGKVREILYLFGERREHANDGIGHLR